MGIWGGVMVGDGVRLWVGLGLGVFDGLTVGLTDADTVQFLITRLVEVRVADALFESWLVEFGTSDVVTDDLQAVTPKMSTVHRTVKLSRRFWSFVTNNLNGY